MIKYFWDQLVGNFCDTEESVVEDVVEAEASDIAYCYDVIEMWSQGRFERGAPKDAASVMKALENTTIPIQVVHQILDGFRGVESAVKSAILKHYARRIIDETTRTRHLCVS